MREKLISMLLDILTKLDLLPREGFGSVIIQIQNNKIISAEIYKETVKLTK